MLALVLVLSACFIFIHRPLTTRPVSLTFQRYSDELDPYVQDVAFLWLTNSSTKSYLLTMPNRTNTAVMDNFFGKEPRTSYLVNCQFRDWTPDRWTDWVQQPSPYLMGNAYLSLGAHSGMIIRVPLPPPGQKRRVAVLCELSPQDSFWNSRVGGRVLRVLPRTILLKVSQRPPVIRRIWCDRELDRTGENVSDSRG